MKRSRRSRKFSLWHFLALLSLASSLLLALLLMPKQCRRKKVVRLENPFSIDLLRPFNQDYGRAFAEDNNYHLASAQKMGVAPITDTLTDKRYLDLSYVTSTEYYQVEKLTHSIPYLTVDAHRLLDYIAYDFAQALKQRNLPAYQLVVTSLTRTEESQKQLSRYNVNAAEKSAHCFATTMDITWKRFFAIEEAQASEAELKKVLASILRQYVDMGFCYVKHERKQACFHITVARPIPLGHIPAKE